MWMESRKNQVPRPKNMFDIGKYEIITYWYNAPLTTVEPLTIIFPAPSSLKNLCSTSGHKVVQYVPVKSDITNQPKEPILE